MNDFSGTEHDFAAGSLFGLRGWGMDEKGRLHGVTHQKVWTPGVNTSQCSETHQVICPAPPPVPAVVPDPPKSKKKAKKKNRAGDANEITVSLSCEIPNWFNNYHATSCGEETCQYGVHTVPNDHAFEFDCTCGFWAYNEGAFTPHGDVIGVTEAFGRVTIGTKGFRAEKARIVALCKLDSTDDPLSSSVVRRLSQLYPDAMWCDDIAQMVEVFEIADRDWPTVDEDFWSEPVPAGDAVGWGRPWFGGGLAFPANSRATYASLHTSFNPVRFTVGKGGAPGGIAGGGSGA